MPTFSTLNINALPINEGDPRWAIAIIDGVPVWVDESGEVKGRAAPGKVPTRNIQNELMESYLRRLRERESEDGDEPEQETNQLVVHYIAADVCVNGGKHVFNAVITNEDDIRLEIAGINTHAPDPIIVVSGVSPRDTQS